VADVGFVREIFTGLTRPRPVLRFKSEWAGAVNLILVPHAQAAEWHAPP
jgi:hypothetical protein